MTLLAQKFDGFNGLCTKVNDMELYLNKKRNQPERVARLGISWPLQYILKLTPPSPLEAGSLGFRKQSKSDNSPF